jgi:hypothetical protein
VTIGRPGEGEDFSFAQETNPLPAHNLTDLGQWHTGVAGGGAKSSELGRRQRQNDLLIVAAGKDALDQLGIGGKHRARRIGQRHGVNINFRREPGGPA